MKKKKKKSKVKKEDIAKLKNLYKKGQLKFNSKQIAGAILKDLHFRKGITK